MQFPYADRFYALNIEETYAAVAPKISTLVGFFDVKNMSTTPKRRVSAPMTPIKVTVSWRVARIPIAAVGKRHAASVMIADLSATKLRNILL